MFASRAISFIENGLSKFSFSQMTAFTTPEVDRSRYRHDYPPLQFCWLRLLPDLLHIPKWRGTKETAVFAGEL